MARHRPLFDDQTLIAVYDLEILPITFDFTWFLIAADLERRRRGMAQLHVLIVPGQTWECGPESAHYLSLIDGPARRQRIFDLLVPLRELLPVPGGITVAGSRCEADLLVDAHASRIFPEGFTPALPYVAVPFPRFVNDAARQGVEIPTFAAPAAGRRWAERWCAAQGEKRPLVTITLRQSDYQPSRNSSLDAWATIAAELMDQGFLVAVIPETHRTLDGSKPVIDGVPNCIEAAWNIVLRAALYEVAYVNLGVNTGPMALAWMNHKARYVTFKMAIEGEPEADVAFQRSLGLDPTKPFLFATPFQRICMDADNVGVLRREIEAIRSILG